LQQGIRSDFFPLGLVTKTLCASSVMHTTCPVSLIFHYLMIIIIFAGRCKSLPSSVCSFLELLSYVRIIFLSTLFSYTLGVRFSLNVGDEVVYSGNIVLLLSFVVALFWSPLPDCGGNIQSFLPFMLVASCNFCRLWW